MSMSDRGCGGVGDLGCLRGRSGTSTGVVGSGESITCDGSALSLRAQHAVGAAGWLEVGDGAAVVGAGAGETASAVAAGGDPQGEWLSGSSLGFKLPSLRHIRLGFGFSSFDPDDFIATLCAT